jgi:AraC-like DNA-binding protein
MYAYLFFAITILGIFSLIENIKGRQKISFIKLNFILLLSCITINSGIDFSIEFGYNLSLYGSMVRLFTTIFIVNVFYFVAANNLPRTVLYIEILFLIFFLIGIFNGYRFMTVYGGAYVNELTILNKINIVVVNPLIILSMIYNMVRISKSTDNTNLYQVKTKKWAIFLFILCLIVIGSIFITIALYYKKLSSNQIDTRSILILYRFLLILFILIRPRFIDEGIFSVKLNNILLKNKNILLTNFEFLFYTNHYYLNSEANLNDFALKLNHSKNEIIDFLNKHTNESFSELLNKNRVKYFKELLKSKQYESFTIEALSEMSGFNNRQTMYNAFNKYAGCSPSEYINNL